MFLSFCHDSSVKIDLCLVRSVRALGIPHLFCLPSVQSTPNVDEFEEGIKELFIKIITSDSKNMREILSLSSVTFENPFLSQVLAKQPADFAIC